LEFGVSCYEALTITYDFLINVHELEGDEARLDLYLAYEDANLALGKAKLTEKEEMLSAAFFALGMATGKQHATYPKLELAIQVAQDARKGKAKGGERSHWDPFSEQIQEKVKQYLKDRSYSRIDLADDIEKIGAGRPSTSTLAGWIRKLKQEGTIFKAPRNIPSTQKSSN